MMPYPGKKTLVLLFLLAFTLKFLTAIFLRYLLSCESIGYHLDELVVRGHDYISYHAAMENYIQTGKYYFFNGKENVYASRLPHFSLLYLFFRQFLNIALADFMVMVVQLGMECVAILVLSWLALRLTSNRFAFYLTFALCIISLPLTYYSIIVLPDSLSVSLLIIFVFSFYSYLKRPSGWLLLLSGLLLGLVVVLKPYFSLLYLGVGLFFLWGTRRVFSGRGLVSVGAKTVVFSLPLLIMLLPWVIRNYQIYQRFIPFQVDMVAGYDYTKADLACRQYLQTFGEDLLYWEVGSAGYYFRTCRDNCSYNFPDYIFTPSNTKARMQAVRTDYQKLHQNFDAERDQQVAAAFNSLTLNFAREKPFRYYIGSRLASLQNFLLQAAPGYLPINENATCFRPFHLVIYYGQVVLYWSTLLIGFIGLYLLIRKDVRHIILIAIPVYLLLLLPVALQFIEGRYFLHSYPFLLLGLVYVIECLCRRFVGGKSLA